MHGAGTPGCHEREAARRMPALDRDVLDGVQEVLRDGEDCALEPPGEREEFAARVSELIEQPALARRYADAALAKVRARYSAGAMTRAVEAIYLQYLEPGQ